MQLFTRTLFFLAYLLISSGFVSAQVIAGFNATPIAGCAPLIVTFTNTTTPSIGTTYVWNLGNGTGIITLTNPGTTYVTAGTYTVTLTATNGTFTNTKTKVITVYPAPIVHFIESDTAVCPNVPVTFTSTSTAGVPGPVSYLWSFGDGYSATTGTVAHSFGLPGHFNVSLNVTNADSCSSILTVPSFIHILTPPAATFSASQTHLCNPPDNAIFSSIVSGAGPFTYLWSFGDGSAGSVAANPIHLYTALGTYGVGLKVTDSRTCIDSIFAPGYIFENSFLASFAHPDSACLNVPVTFTNTSPPFVSCKWFLGDGDTSTSINVTKTYHAPGNYLVSLVIFNAYCNDTIKHLIYIQDPVSTFTVTPAIPCPAPVTVSFAATCAPGSFVLWHFGDSLSGTGKITAHTYLDKMFDSVHMFVTTTVGCKDTVVQQYIVYDFFFAFTVPFVTSKNGCAPHTIHYLTYPATTYPPPLGGGYPAIYTYVWDWGDGSPAQTVVGSTISPDHTYTAVGVYPVKISLSTSNGCSFVYYDTVSIGAKPNVIFSATPLHTCYNRNEIKFTRSLISGSADDYWWLFGEGIYSGGFDDTAKAPTWSLYHHFDLPGIFSDTVIAYSGGCPDTFIRHNYIIIDSPMAKAYPHVLCNPVNTVQFADSSMGADTRIWLFGDGTTSTVTHPVHTYPAAMIYPVKLTTYNIASGCRDTFSFYVNLTHPTVSFSSPDTNICRDGQAVFSSTVSGGFSPYYQWIAGGSGYGAANAYFTDTFHNTGLYTIKLVVFDQNFCPDTFTRINYIHVAKPVAHYSVTPPAVCWPLPANYLDASTDLTGTYITNHNWTFGDGTTTSVGTPAVSHIFTATGNYTTTEIVTDNYGCKDTVTHSFVNVYRPIAGFNASRTAVCAWDTIRFNNTSSAGVTNFWTFGDGQTSTLPNPVHYYSVSGVYTVRLVITDAHVCHDTATHVSYITVSSPVASFTMSDSIAICPPLSVNFTNTSTGSVSSYWNLGNSAYSIATNPNNLYTTPGYDTVILIVTNSSGCKDTAIAHIKVYGYAGSFSYSHDTGCTPLTVYFNADLSNISLASSITWDFSDGILVSSAIDTISHTYLHAGGFIPKLIITDHAGCINTNLGIDTIKANAIIPGFTATPNPVCLNDTLFLTDTSSSYWSHIISWAWTHSGLTDSIAAPLISFSVTGTHTVALHVRDAWGCTADTSKSVSVYALPPIHSLPDSVICAGRKTTLSDSTSGGIWSIDSPTIATIIASTGILTGLTAGIVKITYTLNPGCAVTTLVTVNAVPDPGIITGNTNVCKGSSSQLTDTVPGGVWSCSNNLATISSTGILTGIAPGLDTVKYTVTNINCDSSAQIEIKINPLPDSGIISGQNEICRDAIIKFTENINGGKWTSSDTSVATIDSITGTTKGIHLGSTTIKYTTPPDLNGCINSATFILSVINTDFTANGTINDARCYNDSNGSITVNISGGSPPFKYLWSTGDSSSTISGLDTGIYILHITELTKQCNLIDSFIIAQPDTINIVAEIKEDICRQGKGSIFTTITGGTPTYNYSWSNLSVGPNIENLVTGNYLLSVTDKNGCNKKTAFNVPDTCNDIIIYNAVSPNGDGINDTWIIIGLQLYPNNTVQVFDKWGDEVFSASNYQNDWAGTGKNGLLPDGTYYYLVKPNTPGAPDVKESYTGSLLIKR